MTNIDKLTDAVTRAEKSGLDDDEQIKVDRLVKFARTIESELNTVAKELKLSPTQQLQILARFLGSIIKRNSTLGAFGAAVIATALSEIILEEATRP